MSKRRSQRSRMRSQRSQRRRGWQKGSEQGFDEDESADQSFFCAPLTRIIGRHCAPTPANYQSFLTCAATAPQLRPSETRTAPKLLPHLMARAALSRKLRRNCGLVRPALRRNCGLN